MLHSEEDDFSSELLVVSPEQAGMRLDAYLAQAVGGLSRNAAVSKIEEGEALLNGAKTVKKSLVKAGDCVEIFMRSATEIEAVPQNLPLDILYEDKDIAIINKPQGMVVHPSNGHPDGTLVNALLYHLKDLSGINGRLRPGIVHRLDKDTSGLIAVAKNDRAHQCLAEQFKNRTCKKIYFALLEGNIAGEGGRIETCIDRSRRDRKKMAVAEQGRKAITAYTVYKRFGNKVTAVQCDLLTGRTHQIRVHMAYIGHPCLGDPLYGHAGQFGLEGQALHSQILELDLPSGQRMHFEAELPQYMTALIEKLERSYK